MGGWVRNEKRRRSDNNKGEKEEREEERNEGKQNERMNERGMKMAESKEERETLAGEKQ